MLRTHARIVQERQAVSHGVSLFQHQRAAPLLRQLLRLHVQARIVAAGRGATARPVMPCAVDAVRRHGLRSTAAVAVHTACVRAKTAAPCATPERHV